MKIVCVAGARPNFMKIAPLMHAFENYPEIEAALVHTGQHYDKAMSDVFFEQLGLPEPDANLGVGGGSREEQIDRIMESFSTYLEQSKPDAVLVVGDVNSTVACTRIAKKKNLITIHVEAGLRSFDKNMPEEINRIETDELSDYLFVTEQSGMLNLAKESVDGEAFLVGNVMIDTLVRQLKCVDPDHLLKRLGLKPGQYVVGTFHRPSNVDEKEPLGNVLSIVEYVADQCDILLPLHPRTRNSLEQYGWLERLTEHPNVHVSSPMGYVDFISVVSRAKAIVTDSGGVQEETTYLRVPCVTMRDNTERPVTVELGSNTLAGTDPEQVMRALDKVLSCNEFDSEVPDLWDGHAAERIAAQLDLIRQR